MIKQNPMNNVVRVSYLDGKIEILELAPSQMSELVSEFMDWDDREQRREMFGRIFRDRETMRKTDGRIFRVLDI